VYSTSPGVLSHQTLSHLPARNLDYQVFMIEGGEVEIEKEAVEVGQKREEEEEMGLYHKVIKSTPRHPPLQICFATIAINLTTTP
jgi:hypothetical protein